MYLTTLPQLLHPIYAMPLTKIDIQYNKETNDLGQCTIEIYDHQVNELLQHFQSMFGEELKRASFTKKNDQTVITFLAPNSKIMKSSVCTLIVTLLATSLFAQWGDNYIKLSSTITTEVKNISGFDKIEVSEDFKVYIKFSDQKEKVAIEANEKLHDLIQVEKNGKTLKIYTKPNSTRSGFGKRSGASERLVAYITAKQLTAIKGDEDVVIELELSLIHISEPTRPY